MFCNYVNSNSAMGKFSIKPDEQENKSSFVTIQACSNEWLQPFVREDKTEIIKIIWSCINEGQYYMFSVTNEQNCLLNNNHLSYIHVKLPWV